MSDPPDENDEYLIEAALQLLDSKKSRNYRFCLSCGEAIREGGSLVCSECLGNECDIYNKVADLPEDDDEQK